MAVLATIAVAGIVSFGGAGHPTTKGPNLESAPAAPSTSVPGRRAPAVPAAYADTLIATLSAPTTMYGSPGGPPTGLIPATWHDAVSALPVLARQGQWLEVRLAPRPNGSTAWIEQSTSVSLTETPYRIVIDLRSEHLELFRSGQLVLDAPAGIGTPTYPTPTGQFFLAFFAAAPSPGYGPFVMVTSAHSNRITDWESSGDALVAIHGPLGSDALIGTTGAAVSHGCIRLHLADLEQLRAVPAGSPIDITDD